jgi:cellulose synthase/poly-beta-1,6-N-acetylglucosamine synthase-like glycosyltransferase
MILENIFDFILYPFIFISLYFQVFMLYNFLSNKKKMKEEENIEYTYFPSVTFLLPGWNEGKNIITTIKSIQELDYPNDKIEIFYLDNNSTDDTENIVAGEVKKDSRIKYIFESKQGKHHAMNTGLESVKTDLVACLDVDSTLHINAMKIAAQYFKDEKITALATCMQLRDIKTFWQRAQSVEYMLSIFWRKAYSAIDAIQVMPGPFSVFRKAVFDNLGPYKAAHNAEDFEMTLRLHKNHYKIANAHKAYVYTVGPSTLRGLIKQRVRWIRGFLENAWDYREMFFKKKYGHFGLFTLPVAAVFIFYVLYAVSFTYIKLFQIWYIKIENFLAAGIRLPKLNLDPFYITADVFLFQTIFLFTILAFVLLVSRAIAEDKSPIMPNFAIYFLAYPFIAPLFIFIAVYKFLFKSENKWALQDNKI